jgi:hypothetical protein
MAETERSSVGITWLACAGLVVVMVLVAGIAFGVVENFDDVVHFFPQLDLVRAPLVALGVAVCASIEAMLVITCVLVACASANRAFDPPAPRLVDALVLLGAVATVLVCAASFFVHGPPQLYLLVLAATPIGATATLLLAVLRSGLRRAR